MKNPPKPKPQPNSKNPNQENSKVLNLLTRKAPWFLLCHRTKEKIMNQAP